MDPMPHADAAAANAYTYYGVTPASVDLGPSLGQSTGEAQTSGVALGSEAVARIAMVNYRCVNATASETSYAAARSLDVPRPAPGLKPKAL